MKKHFKTIALIMLTAILLISVFTACDTNEEETFTVTFIADGKEIKTVETKGNEAVAVPEAPPKEGYEFKGWYLDRWQWQEPFDGNNFVSQALTANVKVYAYYVVAEQPAPTEYDVIFYAFGEVVGTVTTAGNETLTLPVAPTKENYEFKGWYFDKDVWQKPFTAEYFADKEVSEAVSVYARYDEKTPVVPTEYAIKFYADGELIETVMSAGNETITLPEAPDKQHYEFKGWYLDDGIWSEPFTADHFADKAVTDDVSVYAKYEHVKYDVSFYADGSFVDKIATAGNETITLPVAPGKENYEFKGWYLDNNVWNEPFDENYFVGREATGNLNVYAKYEYVPATYTVNFDTDGGTELDPVRASVIETEPFTEKSGYDFDGWYLNEDKTEKVTFPFTVEQDCTLYAKWVEKAVTFTLDSYNMISGMSGTPVNGELYIPGTVNGVKVEGIAYKAFSGNTDIVSVEVDPSITYFESYCFSSCSKLKSVKISDDTKSIPSFMFQWCSSLSDIQLPSSLVSIGSSAFQKTNLSTVALPSSVKSIDEYAFKDCNALESVDLGQVEILGQGLFQKCTSLSRVDFPDTVKEIDGNYMFMECYALTEIILPDIDVPLSYNFVDYTAYYNNASNWEDGVLYVGNHLITVKSEFKNKTSYSVRDNTVTIAKLAFNPAYKDSKLTSLTLPEGLKAIGERAFENFSLLESVNIPDSVIKIGVDAFNNTLLIKSGETNYLGNWLINYALPTGESVVEVKEGTIGIADGKITDAQSSVTKVVLPSSLKYIGESNFQSMSNLTEINVPAALVSIGKNAFASCKALTELDLTGCRNLQSIGESAFSWCNSVTSLYIPSNVTNIGGSAFNHMDIVTLYIEIEQDEIPSGWASDWDFTYAADPLNIVWGAKNAG